MRGRSVGLEALEPARVCIVKPSALGDIVNALPALSALRARWPSARITWVVNRGLRGLVDGHPAIDEVLAFDRSRRGFGAFSELFAALRQRRFDVAIDLQGLLRSALMTASTRAPVRAGLADAREGARWLYTHRIPMPAGEAQAVDRLLCVAAAFGADVSRPRHVVALTDDDRRWARSVLVSVPRPRLVLNLGARWETKRWPPAHFAELARRAVAARGAGLIAIGAPEDRPLVAELREGLAPIPLLDLCGATSLPQLAALAAEADVVVSNDTGPLHLATAAGARVVGLYTCTSPRLNGPYGDRAVSVETVVPCAGSYLKRCGRLDCMRELTPERVWPAVLAQLDAALGRGANVA